MNIDTKELDLLPLVSSSSTNSRLNRGGALPFPPDGLEGVVPANLSSSTSLQAHFQRTPNATLSSNEIFCDVAVLPVAKEIPVAAPYSRGAKRLPQATAEVIVESANEEVEENDHEHVPFPLSPSRARSDDSRITYSNPEDQRLASFDITGLSEELQSITPGEVRTFLGTKGEVSALRYAMSKSLSRTPSAWTQQERYNSAMNQILPAFRKRFGLFSRTSLEKKLPQFAHVVRLWENLRYKPGLTTEEKILLEETSKKITNAFLLLLTYAQDAPQRPSS